MTGDCLRLDKFTIKSQELISQAQTLASSERHQQIEPEHLLAAMVKEKEGVAVSIFRKLGVSPGSISRETADALARLPKVSGVGEVYISPRTRTILEMAFSQAVYPKALRRCVFPIPVPPIKTAH